MAERVRMSISGTAEEAEDLVRRAWSGRARLEAVEALAGDASSRSYSRLRLTGDAPPTAVLMRQSGSGLSISSDELSQIDEPPPELPFLNVRRYLESVGIAVPALYADEPERGLVLLEDVGDTALFEAARR